MNLLELRGLGRRYGGLDALRDVSLELPVGARHAVIGANGAGKTTLFHLIAGSTRPTSGQVIYDQRDITRMSPAARARRGIGRTFQHPAVFGRLTVSANIALAITGTPFHPARVQQQVTTALCAADLTEHADTPARDLSYGHRRRLELAIALAARPRLLLLDEPSAGLDPAEVTRLVDTIRGLPNDVTILLVDHHLDFIWDIADTVTVLDHGQHLATGTGEEIRAHPRVHAAYLGTGTRPQTTGADARTDARPVEETPTLRVRALRVGYHGAPVLHDLSFDARAGEILAVLGRNGAGKTTLLNALAGLLPPATDSTIEFDGTPLPVDHPHRTARAGVAIVPQGRRLFDLRVGEHLTVATAASRRHRGTRRRWTREQVLDLLPALRPRLGHHASQLSGGEQQMLALARALLGCPRVLLLDEPAEGLAPAIVQHLAAAVRQIASDGVTVLIAEQNLHLTLGLAHHVLVLQHGQLAFTTAASPLADPSVRRHLDALLGVVPA